MAGVPIRCFTCGKTVAHLYPKYKEMVGKGISGAEALDSLGLGRECCRRMLATNVDIDEIDADYPVFPGRIQRLTKAKIAGGEGLSESSSEPESDSSKSNSESEESDSD